MSSVTSIRNVRLRPDPAHTARYVDVEILGDTITEVIDRGDTGPANGDARPALLPLDKQVIDGQGHFLIPGLINLHTHLFRKVRPGDPPARISDPVAMTVRALRNGFDYLAQGVTTVRDLGAPLDLDIALSELEADGRVVAPRIIACGRPLTETGGHNYDFGVVVDGPDNLRQAVRERILAGVGYIKLMASLGGTRYFKQNLTELPPYDLTEAQALMERIIKQADPDKAYSMTERDGYTLEELTAAADEATRQGYRTCAHAVTAQSLINGARAGLTTVEHGTFMNRAAAAVLADSATLYVPTISTSFNRVLYGKAEGWPDYLLRWAVFVAEPWFASVRVAADAGLPVGVGTDAGGEMILEMQLMHRAGYTRHTVLRAATEVAAQALGRSDLGRVAPGTKADLVLLAQDPLEDLSSLTTPLLIIKGGRVFTRDHYQL